jgi:hypothetical protein
MGGGYANSASINAAKQMMVSMKDELGNIEKEEVGKLSKI